jgi:hypothetical protein
VISQVYYYERKNALGVVAEREGLLEDDDGQPEIHDE